MRDLTGGAVLLATTALSIGLAAPASADRADGAQQPPRVAAFTPPIGTNHGSAVPRPQEAGGPTGYEMDIMW